MVSLLLGSACILAASAGCSGGILFKSEIKEFMNPRYHRGDFTRIALVAGGDNHEEVRIASDVREMMKEGSWDLVRVQGLWENEEDAVTGICASQDPGVDGVLFVWWNRLSLRACKGERGIAYDVSGGYAGTERLTERLLRYLGPRNSAGTQSSPAP